MLKEAEDFAILSLARTSFFFKLSVSVTMAQNICHTHSYW